MDIFTQFMTAGAVIVVILAIGVGLLFFASLFGRDHR